MLSIISSIYNPLAFASRFVLEERQLLQTMCSQNMQWDNVVGPELKDGKIPRCIKPRMFGKIANLHYFLDTSEEGYGQYAVTYD